MPMVDDRKYPDDIPGILKDRKLRKLFSIHAREAKDDSTRCVKFVVTQPRSIGPADLELLCKHGGVNGVTEAQMGELLKLRHSGANEKDINAWPELPAVVRAVCRVWLKDHGKESAKQFYAGTVFKNRAKYEKGFASSGNMFAAMDIDVTAKTLEKLGYTDTRNKKIQASIRDLARAELTKRTDFGKKKFQEIQKLEPCFDSYVKLVAALKKIRLI